MTVMHLPLHRTHDEDSKALVTLIMVRYPPFHQTDDEDYEVLVTVMMTMMVPPS